MIFPVTRLGDRWMLCAALALALSACREAPPPSILFVSIDTLRADRLGIYGHHRPTSPYLDALAARSIVFDAAFVQEPRTLTSHMSMMTSLYPDAHGVSDEVPLAAGVPTLAQVLRQRGYATQAFTGGGWMGPRWGLDRGFDGYDHSGIDLEPKLLKIRAWLHAQRDRPFFLFLHSYDVHGKGMGPLYLAPPPFRGRFTGELRAPVSTCRDSKCYARRFNDGFFTEADRRFVSAAYDESIAYVDARIGELLRYAEELGLLDRLIVLVTSDHGEGLLDHEHWSHGELYDEVLRVPLILRLPGDRHAGRRIPWLVESLDLAPTLLGLVGIDPPAAFQGFDLSSRLADRVGPRDAIHAVRARGAEAFLARTVRTRDWKLIRRHGRTELYDLATDPHEQRNRAAAESERVESLSSRLRGPVPETGGGSATTGAGLEPETAEQLRALGYLE
jgi:arylsulfatase A-like enzyme